MLEKGQIVRALERLAQHLVAQGVEGEICLLGGTVMVLSFHARSSTKDVDAVFAPATIIRQAALQVQSEQGLPDDWLNDGAKGFLSKRHEAVSGDLPQFPGLRITAPPAQYMLAMKCMASRMGLAANEPGDVGDIKFLIHHLGLRSPEEALQIVAQYYPANLIPPRTGYLLEEIFAEEAQP